MKLRGRLIIVTGASSGLGRAIARDLAIREEADVVLAARRRDRLESLRDEIVAAGRGRAWVCEVDVAAAGGSEFLIAEASAIAAARTSAGGALPFGLVNNAGITHYGRVSEMSEDDLARVLDLNVAATMELTRSFLRLVSAREPAATSHDRRRESEPRAAILTITSIAAHLAVPYQAAYAASKHALHGFCSSLWFELRRAARDGGPRIVTSEFAPGGIATEMIERSGLDERFEMRDVAKSPVLAPAEKVARAAVRAWKRERRSVVGGIANKLTVAAARFLPVALTGRMAERLYRPK
ncbi:MAG: SDR family NAD(P)-dependent oxidoreductase [Spirochaetota bacterium]